MVVAVIVLGKLLCGCDSADVIITVCGASIVPLILLDSWTVCPANWGARIWATVLRSIAWACNVSSLSSLTTSDGLLVANGWTALLCEGSTPLIAVVVTGAELARWSTIVVVGEPGQGWITMGGGLEGDGLGVARDGNTGHCTASPPPLLLTEGTTRVGTVGLFMYWFCAGVEASLFWQELVPTTISFLTGNWTAAGSSGWLPFFTPVVSLLPCEVLSCEIFSGCNKIRI